MQQDKHCYRAFNTDPSTTCTLRHTRSIDKWNSRLPVPEGQHYFSQAQVEATLLKLNFSARIFIFIFFQLFLCWQGSMVFVKFPARINVTVQRKNLFPPYQATHHNHLNQLCHPKVGLQWKPTPEADIRMPSLYQQLPYVSCSNNCTG